MAITIDASTPSIVTQTNPSTATLTTSNFTPADNSLLLIRWAGNSHQLIAPAMPTITDNLGTHLVYTLIDWVSILDNGSIDGQAACWYATVNTGTAMNITVTHGSLDNRQAALHVTVINGHDPLAPIGAHGIGTSTSTSSISQSYTGSASGSQGFIVDSDWTDQGAQTAGTGCTLTNGGSGSIPTQISYAFARRTSADGTNGGTTTLALNLPGSSNKISWTYVEVLPPAIVDDPFSPWANPIPWPLLRLLIMREQAAIQGAPPADPVGPPTLIQYEETSWSTSSNPKSTGTISWQTGDVIAVIGGTEAPGIVITTVTATGLTFAAGTPQAVASSCWANSWTAVAGSNGSSTVDIDKTGAGQYGAAVWVYRGSTGIGARGANSTTAKIVSVTRTGTSSAVVEGMFDFSAAVVTGRVWTPVGETEQEASAQTGYSVYAANWGNQGAPGATSYGISGTASTGVHTKIALEILGSVSANDQPVTPLAIPVSDNIGNPTITVGPVTAPVNYVPSSEAFGNVTVSTTYTVNANAISPSEILGNPAVTIITSINANGIASSDAVGNAITTTTYTVQAQGISSAEISGNPNVASASVVLSQGITSSETLGQPAVTTTTTINANGITSSERLGASTTTTTVTVGANGIASSTAVGNSTVQNIVSTSGITSSERLGQPTVTSTITVNAQGISSNEVLGNPNAITASSIIAQNIPSSELFGAPTVTPGSVTITAGSITSGETVGFAAISVGVSNVAGNGVPSSERLGNPTVTPGLVTVTANSITSNEALGNINVSVGASIVLANGISTTETLGSPTVTVGAATISSNSITSSERLGSATVTTSYTVNANGIKSSETIGQAVAGTASSINAGGISSSDRLGSPSVTTGSVTVSANGIVSEVSFGASIVSLGLLAKNVVAQSITSEATVGYPHTGKQVTINITMRMPSDGVFTMPQDIISVVLPADETFYMPEEIESTITPSDIVINID